MNLTNTDEFGGVTRLKVYFADSYIVYIDGKIMNF